jgi:hypothetical protein
VIIDCDDTAALAAAEREYGPTPLMVRTPRRAGWHRYYRAPDGPVRQQSLRRSHDLAIEIKAGPGAVVIVPPSVRPSTGRPYTFARGDWAVLASLPVFRPAAASPSPSASSAEVGEGARNRHLFRELLRYAKERGCDDSGVLVAVAHLINERDCIPPLPWPEVEKIAKSAWKYHASGNNWVGSGRRLIVAEAEAEVLFDESDALALWMRLCLSHQERNETFAVSAKAMAAAGVMPGWSVQRYRKARDVLLDRGFLAMVHEGGRGQRDPDLFTLRPRASDKGAKSAPNTNKTPSPAPREAPPAARPRRKAA